MALGSPFHDKISSQKYTNQNFAAAEFRLLYVCSCMFVHGFDSRRNSAAAKFRSVYFRSQICLFFFLSFFTVKGHTYNNKYIIWLKNKQIFFSHSFSHFSYENWTEQQECHTVSNSVTHKRQMMPRSSHAQLWCTNPVFTNFTSRYRTTARIAWCRILVRKRLKIYRV